MGVRKASVSRHKERNQEGPEICCATTKCVCNRSAHVTEPSREDNTQNSEHDQVFPLSWNHSGAARAMSEDDQYNRAHIWWYSLCTGHYIAECGWVCEGVWAQTNWVSATKDNTMRSLDIFLVLFESCKPLLLIIWAFSRFSRKRKSSVIYSFFFVFFFFLFVSSEVLSVWYSFCQSIGSCVILFSLVEKERTKKISCIFFFVHIFLMKYFYWFQLGIGIYHNRTVLIWSNYSELNNKKNKT